MSIVGDWLKFFFRDWLDFWTFVICALFILAWAYGLIGCAAPGAVDLNSTILSKTDLDAVTEAIIMMDADVKAVGVDLSTAIDQTSKTTQEAVAAVSITDQSSSDKWVNRGMMIGVVGLAVLIVVFTSYPVGKRRWLKNGIVGPPHGSGSGNGRDPPVDGG